MEEEADPQSSEPDLAINDGKGLRNPYIYVKRFFLIN